MIRANMGEILKKSRDKYTLVLMSSKAARTLIQRETLASANADASAPKDAYALKDSSKHLSEAVKGIEDGLITLKTTEEVVIDEIADNTTELEEGELAPEEVLDTTEEIATEE